MDRISTSTKATDLFGTGKHGFKDGNLTGGIAPTDFNAAWFNDAQEEMLGIIEGAGITPAAGTRNQLAKALQDGALWSATAGGTADAITATFTPTVTTMGKAAAGARHRSQHQHYAHLQPRRHHGQDHRQGQQPAPGCGDVAGAGYWMHLQGDTTLDKWVLLNPATG